MTGASIARVLVDSPLPQLDRLLDYRIPDHLTGIVPGVRVTVPLRSARRLATAYVIELGSQQDYPGPLSDIEALVSPVPVLRPEVWRLARAMADRAAGSAADIVRLAVPPRQVRVEKAWLARSEADSANSHPAVEARAITDYDSTLTEALVANGRIALKVRPGMSQLDPEIGIGRWAQTLAELAVDTLAKGRTAIVVLPDHRDQDQLAAALATMVPSECVVRVDARQPNPDRYKSLLRASDGPVVVLGNRSAVYAPASKLGLLVVWNDGDPLLAEPLSPYVHARDAALVRHEQQGGALVIAGHTCSTEVQRLVEMNWLTRISPLGKRRHPRVIPTANLMSQDRLAAQARIPPSAWRAARDGAAEGPVLIQVARPGFAPGLRCTECGDAARCRRCAGPLRQRRSGAAPSCAWCGAIETSWACTNCAGTTLRTAGSGSQRTADELGRAFPGARVIVSDGERQLLQVDDRPALVIATRGAEPVARSGYRAVLLLDGERMAARETLRVGEDVLRWWSDAAALAADDAPVVVVGVGGALASALVTWQQSEYARRELEGRRALRFPPAVRMATLLGAPGAVSEALHALPDSVGVIGTTEVEGRIRALLRFDYAHGAEVATVIRREIVRQATAKRKPVPGSPPRGRQPLPLRAHFDDPAPFDE
ncbi:MAG TPA: primosomal protein N' [Pseudolysinimonas sp.]|nr:primosomal protein N' [Pseudolysinimonas sp.]